MNGLEPLIPAAQIGDASSDGKEVLAELEEVRYWLTDVEERVDFTERILVRGRDQAALPGSDR